MNTCTPAGNLAHKPLGKDTHLSKANSSWEYSAAAGPWPHVYEGLISMSSANTNKGNGKPLKQELEQSRLRISKDSAAVRLGTIIHVGYSGRATGPLL